MSRKTDIGSSNAQYTRSYGNLRGVDFSADPSQVNPSRCPYLVNMYRDYDSEHGAAIETIPGFRRLFHFDGEIHGIWGYSSTQEDEQERHVVVHAGSKLYTFKMDERDSGGYELRYDKLADAPSTAFLQNNNFYICDGIGIYIMKADFSVKSIKEEAYVPITYLHGVAYEQRNMLTDRFVNRDTVVSEEFEAKIYISYEDFESFLNKFIYEVEKKVSDGYSSDSFTIYKVSGYLAEYHQHKTEIEVFGTGLHNYEGDRYYTQISVEQEPGDIMTHYNRYGIIFDEDFAKDIERVIVLGNKNATNDEFYGSQFPNATEICYTGDYATDELRKCDVYLYDPCEEVLSVKVGDVEIPNYKDVVASGEAVPDTFYMPVSEIIEEDGVEQKYVSYVRIFDRDAKDIDGKLVDVKGVARTVTFQTANKVEHTHTDYVTSNQEYEGTSKEAILGCGISATFDGRVFLTGNKKLPNTVFYSCRDLTGYNNPTYYGVYNYFNDGEGNEPNVALLSTSSVLMVLKRNTLQGSAIYYHTAADGIDDVVPRIYPSTPGVAGLGCEGAAMNFLDDAVFLSERGLEGLSKQQLNLERTIGHRSSSVDRLLRERDLSKARMCRFETYLCIFDGEGGIFLADSVQLYQGKDGTAEYEWFYLEGVGDYEGDYELYRTLTQYPEIYVEGNSIPHTLEGATLLGSPLLITETAEEVSPSEIYTGEAELHADDGVKLVSVKYVDRGGLFYLCDTDGERTGGTFSPSCFGYTSEDVFLFGTKGGSVCCFNTDKRGVDPYGEDSVESNAIHRSFYSFVGHRYLSGLSLRSDNCGVPHLTKRTARKTCVAKLKTMRGSGVSVKIRTDREPWHEVISSFASTDFSFSNMEFDHFSFSSESDTIVTIKDKEKKWVEKQFYFYSDGYCRPFGLHDLTFNYEIQGRVKRN